MKSKDVFEMLYQYINATGDGNLPAGKRKSAYYCPIAEAIKWATEVQWIVGVGRVISVDPSIESIELSPLLQQFITEVDNSGDVNTTITFKECDAILERLLHEPVV